MPATDLYEWTKSNMPQDLMKDMPFSDFQYNYLNDINSSIYQNSSLSLVEFNLSSIYNSSTWTLTSDHFMVLPTVTTAVYTTGASANAVAPLASGYAQVSLKNFNQTVIHQAEIKFTGSSASELQPYSNLLWNVKLASQLSDDDLILCGRNLGIPKAGLDSASSQIYANSAGPTTDLSTYGVKYPSYPSLSNNCPFNDAANVFYSNTQLAAGNQNKNCVNKTLQEKVQWYQNLSGSRTQNNFSGTLFNGNTLNQAFEPYYTVIGNVMVWYDYLIINMKDIFDIMDKVGLTRKMDAVIRIYVNTGLCSVDFSAGPASAMNFNQQYSTFTNTCPITINNIGNANTTVPAAATNLTAGFFIGKVPNYGISTSNGANVNFSTYGITSNPMQACRYYYSQITLQPSKALEYISSNTSKRLVYEKFYYNTFSNISAGASWSQLIQSGVSNIKSVIVMPFISSSTLVNGSAIGFSQYQSPFDTCGGCSFAPLNLINFQVKIGGKTQLDTPLGYDYENFLQEISKFNKATANEYGIESGLFSLDWWKNNKFYVVNVRAQQDDMQTNRNVDISFTNTSMVPIDIIVFVVFEDKATINVNTGLLSVN